MKITFFLIAFCLVFMRLYMGWTGHWGNNNGNDGTMTYNNGDDYSQIKWSGKVKLKDDETGVESISPGGYLKFKHNDAKMTAESNLQGDITYELYDGQHELALDEKGKKFLAAFIHEMIEFGYDATGRMERIYQKGGKIALLEEEEKLKSDNLKSMYLDRLLKCDSLTKEELIMLIKQIGGLDADYEKEQHLNRFDADQLKDSGTVQAWLGVVDHMGSDDQKSDLLKHLIDKDSLSDEVVNKILEITGRLGADWQKQNLLSQLIDKSGIPANHSDKLLDEIGHLGDDQAKESLLSKLIDQNAIPQDRFKRMLELITHFGADYQKQNLYKKLIEKNALTEEQWASLVNGAALIGSDFDKSNLLVDIARKMPKTDSLRTVYIQAAKTINGDMEYGKALRAVE